MTTTPMPPPYAAVPHTRLRRKLPDRRVRSIASIAVVAIAGIISAVAVLVRPNPQSCGVYCGPRVDTPVQGAATYVNRAHGFSIDYPPGQLQVAADQPDLVEFHSSLGPIQFRVLSTSSLADAINQALQQLPSTTFQDVQAIGPVRGAEIGYVLGAGTAYSATYVPSDGGGTGQVRVAILAARSNGLTVVATMFSDYDPDTAHAPYGLKGDALFDYPVSNFHFRGEQ
jgi:hypothetical protein